MGVLFATKYYPLHSYFARSPENLCGVFLRICMGILHWKMALRTRPPLTEAFRALWARNAGKFSKMSLGASSPGPQKVSKKSWNPPKTLSRYFPETLRRLAGLFGVPGPEAFSKHFRDFFGISGPEAPGDLCKGQAGSQKWQGNLVIYLLVSVAHEHEHENSSKHRAKIRSKIPGQNSRNLGNFRSATFLI